MKKSVFLAEGLDLNTLFILDGGRSRTITNARKVKTNWRKYCGVVVFWLGWGWGRPGVVKFVWLLSPRGHYKSTILRDPRDGEQFLTEARGGHRGQQRAAENGIALTG